jgi:His/Glu/Gln/Arg/opine family amino acid ABC transporter permease subunit
MTQSDARLIRHQAPPLWRDIRVLQLVGQFIFALIVILVIRQLVFNVLDSLDTLERPPPNLQFWDADHFFQNPARFSIHEGIKTESTDPVYLAFWSGIWNTLRAVVLGIILATILGIFIGVGRLSNNFLVRNIAIIYIEIFRNTPLLVQLIFIYQGVFLALPLIQDVVTFPNENLKDGLFQLTLIAGAVVLAVGVITYLRGLLRARGGGEGPNLAIRGRVIVSLVAIGIAGLILFVLPTDMIYLSIRGLVIPAFNPTDTFPIWMAFVGLAILSGAFLWYVRSERERRTGLPGKPWIYATVAFFVIVIFGWIAVNGAPISVDMPEPYIATRSGGRQVLTRIEGGENISPEYAALLVGLVLYTAAFIGEIVRAGIQAVSYGQLEAAYAVGLTKGETLRRIVLPQALRVIIPPLGNQYLNLTKNSSLATAIGFMDVFAVTKTLIHQTGRDVTMIIAVMITYLFASLTISAGMNWLNGRMRLKER